MKRIILVIMCLMLIISTLTFLCVSVNAEISGDYKYSVFSNGTVEITKYQGSSTTLKIPSTINGKQVTSLGFRSFYNCTSLISVTIPNSITSIGNQSFEDCTSLKSITIPDSVTSLGSYVFYNCKSLTSITIPNGVTSIGSSVFECCTSLTSINVDKNNKNYCDIDGVLFNKDKTKLIQYPIGNKKASYTIPNSTTSIGSWAFSKCTSLTSITIPNSVTSIGSWAFEYCSPNLTIYGNEKSEAQIYAKNNDINFVNLKEHTHSYTAKTTKQPTCTEPGVKTYTCSCGYSYTVKISALNHKWDQGKITVAGDCCTNRILTYTCTLCKKTTTRNYGKVANKHVYSNNYTVDKKATYFETGLKAKYCVKCKKAKKSVTTIPKLKLSTPKVKYVGKKGNYYTLKYTKVTGSTGLEIKYKVGTKWKTTTVTTKKSGIKINKVIHQVQIRAFVKSGSKKAYSSYKKLNIK